MSIIGLAMNLLLAGLLIAALGMGWRLNRRLKALRDSHDGFAAAVTELNIAAARAEQGLADLRSATDEAVDILGERIERGRTLATRLDRLIEHAGTPLRGAQAPAAAASLIDDPVAERRLGALLAAAREARPERAMPPLRAQAPESQAWDRPAFQRMASQSMTSAGDAPRARPRVEDDLFDDEPLTLNDVRGARR